MALVVADRVKETTTSTGTGAISLAGAEPNFRTFSSVLSDGDTTYYAIIDDTNTAFEVGLGTYASSGNTITRTTVLSSSNSNNAVSFSAGSKDVLLTYPADKSAYLDGSNQLVINSTAVTSTAAELNLLDGATANTVVNSKAVIYGSGGQIAATSYTGDGSALSGIDASPAFTATASGSIANGDPVILNSDGTVSKPAGANRAAGASAAYNAGNSSNYSRSVFDSNSNKHLIVYRDQGNSNYFTGVVATISGSTVTYGTPAVISSVSAYPFGGCFDPDTNQCIFHYVDTSHKAVVISISGTTFTAGTPVEYDSGSFSDEYGSYPGIDYDTTNDKVVIGYRDQNNSNYGTGIVGTVSGTSISFGTPTVFESSTSQWINVSFDSGNTKSVFSYIDSSSDGRSVVGTVSGTGISFGTSVEPLGAETHSNVSTCYDPDSGKIIWSAKETGSNDGGYIVVGTVSGTAISFGEPAYFSMHYLSSNTAIAPQNVRIAYDTNANKPVVFFDSRLDLSPKQKVYAAPMTISGTTATVEENVKLKSPSWDYSFLVETVSYDSNAGQFLVVYRDTDDDTRYGFAYTAPYSTLTAGNFVGISNAAYADGNTATIQLAGSVDDAQTGLTTGSGYYVQLDGSLGTDDTQTPSVFAGVATSSTNLLIKG